MGSESGRRYGAEDPIGRPTRARAGERALEMGCLSGTPRPKERLLVFLIVVAVRELFPDGETVGHHEHELWDRAGTEKSLHGGARSTERLLIEGVVREVVCGGSCCCFGRRRGRRRERRGKQSPRQPGTPGTACALTKAGRLLSTRSSTPMHTLDITSRRHQWGR